MKTASFAGLCLLASIASSLSAPIGYWNFDNNADDQSAGGANDGTLLGGAAYDDVTPRPAALASSTHSVRFDGVNGSLVSINNGAGGMNVSDLPAFSIAMWVKGPLQKDKRVFSEASTTSTNPLYNIGTKATGTGGEEVDFYRRDAGGTLTNNHLLSTAKPFNDTWHHLVWVDAAGAVRLYVDGVLDRTFTYTDTSLGVNATSFGGILRGASCCSFTGNIDDAAIWDVVLTQAEITTLASGVSPLLIPFDLGDNDGDGLLNYWEVIHTLDKNDNGLDPNNNGVAGNPEFGAAGDPDMDGLSNALEFSPYQSNPRNPDTDGDGINDGPEVTDGTNPILADTDNDGLSDSDEKTRTTNPLVVDTDGDGVGDGTEVTNGTNPLDPSQPALSALLCAYWPLDVVTGEAPALTTPDAGPGGYALALTNMDATHFVPDEGRTAAAFDGNVTMRLLSRTSMPGEELPINQHGAFTVSLWTKTSGTGQSDLRLFSEASTTTNNPLFNIGTHNVGTTGAVNLFLRNPGNTTAGVQLSNGTPLDGTWHHLAVAVDRQGGRVKLYVDGVLNRDNYAFRDPYSPALNTTSIGGILRATASHWVTGLMDDVSLWKAALPAATIASLAAGDSPLDLIGGQPFIITAVARNAATNAVTLTWNSKPGKIYAVRFSTDLVGDPRNWADLTDSWRSGGEETTYVDTVDAGANPVRYYVIEQK